MILKVLALIIFLSYLIGIIISLNILLENRDPSKTLLWLLMFMIFPGIGIFFYVFSGRNIRKQKLFRAKTRSSKLSHRQLLYSMEALKEIVKNQQKMLEDGVLMGDEVSPIKERVVRLLFNIGQFPYTTNNELEIYKDGHEKFASLIKDMKGAKDHIHLEYFIVKDSQIAREIQAILIDKARSGVEVRLLYDDFACWRLKIKRSFLRELKEAGVKCAAFLPTKFPIFGGQLNYRNHRKIAVIDGKISYTGGLNIGDEYMGRFKKFGYWRDSHIRIRGIATHMLQLIFIVDWYLTTKELLNDEKYMPKMKTVGNTAIQVVGTGPDSKWEDIHYAFFSAISQAK